MAEDFLDGWRYYQVLAAHKRIHPKWMNAGELARELGVTLGPAADYRRTLQEAGILEVDEGLENSVRYVRTRLTPDGQKVADHLIEAATVVRRAREKKPRG